MTSNKSSFGKIGGNTSVSGTSNSGTTGTQGHGQRQGLQRQQYRVLDDAARNRRNRHQLEQLEKDNFHDDPHANLVMHKKAPKFEATSVTTSGGHSNGTNYHTSVKRHALPRSRMLSFAGLLEEDMKSPEPNYMSVSAPSPDGQIIPDDQTPNVPIIARRHWCSVCGLIAPYTCVSCGSRYCTINCLKHHNETRCLKWTA